MDGLTEFHILFQLCNSHLHITNYKEGLINYVVIDLLLTSVTKYNYCNFLLHSLMFRFPLQEGFLGCMARLLFQGTRNFTNLAK